MGKTKDDDSEGTEQPRIRRAFMRKVRMAAAAADLAVGDYIQDRLEPIVNAELPAAVVEMGLTLPEEGEGQRGPKNSSRKKPAPAEGP